MKKRILVCDDEPSIRLLLREILSELYEIDEASDGREALKKIDENIYDLLIIDIKMPHMHGIEAITRIRQTNESVPIIVCTAYRLMEDALAIKKADIAGFIHKPIDIKSLKCKVFELIGS
jgi:CheY-like chemotaxis protein